MTDTMDVGSLSLDDIIKKEGIRGGKFGNRNRRDGGVGKPKRNPKMWQNDKFFEAQGSRRFGNGDRSSKAIARLSNIPYTITQEDLNDLFADYRLNRIALHYDFRGRSLGTAELHGPQNIISRLAREFKDVEIDGRPLEIQVVGSGGSRSAGLSPRIRRVGGGRADRRQNGNKGRGGPKKQKLSPEELDAELDAYMQTATKN